MLVLDVRADPALAASVGVSVFLADVRDDRSADAAIENVDGVIHLAGVSGMPMDVIDHNLQGSINVLDAAYRHGVPVVLATRLNNAVLSDPESIISQAVERFAGMYAKELGSVVNVVRLGDSYGPPPAKARQKGLVSKLLTQALQGEDLVVDAHRKVDAIHVRDVADVLVDALWYGAEIGPLPVILEVGTGTTYTAAGVAAEVAEKVAHITGTIPTIQVTESGHYIDQQPADASSLGVLYPEGRNFIEFETGLDETLESTRWGSK